MRYSDVDAFKAGKDIAIVELNGVTSESTNLYDPRRSLFSAYRILFEQWAILFRIGEANRRLGFRPTPLMTLVRLMSEHFFERRPSIAAD
jgi:hypothetical protein